jgi:Immunity protein Imm1
MTVRLDIHSGMGGKRVAGKTIRSPVEVRQIVAELNGASASIAVINHLSRPATGNIIFYDGRCIYDHEVLVAINDDWGYLRMWALGDGDGTWIIDGHPSSPSIVNHAVEFPAGAGIPLPQLETALCEFLMTAARPQCIQWRAEHVD